MIAGSQRLAELRKHQQYMNLRLDELRRELREIDETIASKESELTRVLDQITTYELLVV